MRAGGGTHMKVALGLKAHSGWAALVAVGGGGVRAEVVDRRRIELLGEDEAGWGKHPYHSAEDLSPPEARHMVGRAHDAARRHAVREMREAVRRLRKAGHDPAACAVLMGEPMPDWSVEEIIAVHFRMHKAEGALFRSALVRAAAAVGLRLIAIPEKHLRDTAERVLAAPWSALVDQAAAIGKSVGPPWGKDQKEAALAALIALRGA